MRFSLMRRNQRVAVLLEKSETSLRLRNTVSMKLTESV